jgi:hypothetical protein
MPPAVPAAAAARGASPGLHRPGQQAIRAGRPRRRPARSSGPDESTADYGSRARRRAGPPASHSAAAIIATAAVALMAAACSSAPSSARPGRSPNPGGAATSSNAGEPANAQLSFSRCVRSDGVPNFPDPQAGASNAKYPSAQQLRVSSSQLSTAETACQHLLPAGIDDQFPPAEVPLLLRSMLPFSSCMRSHGVPSFPDPAADSEGRPIYPLSTRGISLSDSHSQRFSAVVGKCQYLVPRQLGGIPFG